MGEQEGTSARLSLCCERRAGSILLLVLSAFSVLAVWWDCWGCHICTFRLVRDWETSVSNITTAQPERRKLRNKDTVASQPWF